MKEREKKKERGKEKGEKGEKEREKGKERGLKKKKERERKGGERKGGRERESVCVREVFLNLFWFTAPLLSIEDIWRYSWH